MFQRLVLAFCFSAICAMPSHAQESKDTNGVAAEIANRAVDKKGIGLTAEQGQLIAALTKDEKAQTPPDEVAIGAPIPNEMMLNEVPIEVKDRIGILRDFKFARIHDDVVVLVDPTNRVIVDVIKK